MYSSFYELFFDTKKISERIIHPVILINRNSTDTEMQLLINKFLVCLCLQSKELTPNLFRSFIIQWYSYKKRKAIVNNKTGLKINKRQIVAKPSIEIKPK